MSESLPDGFIREKIPQHIAIIMDGNGRWAKQRGLPRIAGHRAGAEAVREVVRACGEFGVKVLTLYAFSVDNWVRPKNEVSALWKLLKLYLMQEIKELNENNVQLRTIGRTSELPDFAQEELAKAIRNTSSNTGLILNLALNYGGRAEIVDAVKRILKEEKPKTSGLTEENFSSYLYTDGLPEPDLLIRTSGEMRISNFLLWQLAYTEIWITNILWPDFRKKNLIDAILDFQKRERRFGGINKSNSQVQKTRL